MPTKPSTPYPCDNCGYDLRATKGEVCPECGCKINRRIHLQSSIDQNESQVVIDALGDFRKGVDWTLVAWLGCVAFPFVGQLAWVVLALVSGWRMIALGRLESSGFLDGFKQYKLIQAWPLYMKIELALAIFGALCTLVASMNDVPVVLFAALVLLRIAWLGLVSLNNFSAGVLGFQAVTKFEGEAPHPAFRFLPLAIFGAPILSVPFFLQTIVAELVKIPGWVSTITNLLLVFACILGIASVILIHTVLEQASDAIYESKKKRSARQRKRANVEIEDSAATAHLKQKIFPDPPPAPGDGDVIPFENDSTDSSRS